MRGGKQLANAKEREEASSVWVLGKDRWRGGYVEPMPLLPLHLLLHPGGTTVDRTYFKSL